MQLESDPAPQQNPTSQSEQPMSGRSNWVVVTCATISAVSAGLTVYANFKVQAIKEESGQQITKIKSDTEQKIATITADTEQKIATIKAQTEKDVRQAEWRSQENILVLKDQLETEKDQRALRAAKCEELKGIRDGMSIDISHLRYNDPEADAARFRLETVSYKTSSYLTLESYKVVMSLLKDKTPSPTLEGNRDLYTALLEGYNAEISRTCAR